MIMTVDCSLSQKLTATPFNSSHNKTLLTETDVWEFNMCFENAGERQQKINFSFSDRSINDPFSLQSPSKNLIHSNHQDCVWRYDETWHFTKQNPLCILIIGTKKKMYEWVSFNKKLKQICLYFILKFSFVIYSKKKTKKCSFCLVQQLIFVNTKTYKLANNVVKNIETVKIKWNLVVYI